MPEFKLTDLTGIQLFLIIAGFLVVGIVLAYFLWALFVILLIIGAFIILHEFLHYLRGD